MMRGTYTRWTVKKRPDGSLDNKLSADWVGSSWSVTANTTEGTVTLGTLDGSFDLDPDTARMLAVRLIEAAAYAGEAHTVRVIG